METKELGQRIQKMLDEQGISRKEFAAMTGLTEAAISRYCTGAREPKSVTLAAIANALGVSIRLVARSANEIPSDKRRELITALLDFTN